MSDDASTATRLDVETEAVSVSHGMSSPGEVPACCVDTIRQHVKFNPMMVCSRCKQIIKCFAEERAFRNYLTFCQSRRRPVLVGMVENHFTVVFNTYDTKPVTGSRGR